MSAEPLPKFDSSAIGSCVVDLIRAVVREELRKAGRTAATAPAVSYADCRGTTLNIDKPRAAYPLGTVDDAEFAPPEVFLDWLSTCTWRSVSIHGTRLDRLHWDFACHARQFPAIFYGTKSFARMLERSGYQVTLDGWGEQFVQGIALRGSGAETAPQTPSPFMDWLDARVVYGQKAKGLMVSAKALYDDFKEWAADQGHTRVMSATAFGRALGERRIDAVKFHGNIWRTPARLRDRAADAVPTGDPEDW